jgi:hypothetical protein
MVRKSEEESKMKGNHKKMNTKKIRGGRAMLKKMKGIFRGCETGGVGLGIAIAIAIVIIITPPLVRTFTSASNQFSAPNKVSMDESESMAPVQDAARDGMHRTMKNAGDVVKGATTATSAQDLAIGHVVDTAVAVSTGDTKTTTNTGQTVTGSNLDKNTKVTEIGDDAASGMGDGSGGYSGGGCTDGCSW